MNLLFYPTPRLYQTIVNKHWRAAKSTPQQSKCHLNGSKVPVFLSIFVKRPKICTFMFLSKICCFSNLLKFTTKNVGFVKFVNFHENKLF
jgi:hypothetical protein